MLILKASTKNDLSAQQIGQSFETKSNVSFITLSVDYFHFKIILSFIANLVNSFDV